MTTYDDGTEYYWAVKYIAQSAISRGQVVCFDQGNNQRIIPVPTAGNMNDMPIGVATANIGAGVAGFIAITGLVYVLPDLAITAVVGDVIYCSATTAG